MEIIFEDAHLIVVSKACGETVVFGRNLKEKPLNYLLSEKLGHCVYPVHRLDKETSGVCLFAKDPQTQRRLSSLFEARKIKKTYWALVSGKLEGQGSIDAPLKLFGSGRTGVSKEGKPSSTLYRALQSCQSASLLELSPLSGRRHQIRAHLYFIGHPILGDSLYGKSAIAAPRLMLHALKILIPESNWPSFESQIPEDFENLYRRILSQEI
jgi:RluA family pseudouridine synthase